MGSPDVSSDSVLYDFDDFTIYPSHPFYVHPSDSPGAHLVSPPFDGNGFVIWRKNILTAIYNDMVIAWITNSLSKDIANSVMGFDTAKDIWDNINERFGTSNDSKYIQIQREISVASQGPLDIATYFTKLRGLWDELNTAYVGPSNILMMPSLPSLSKAYSMLQHDEKQKETSAPISSFSNESASFNASSSPVQAPARSFTQRFQFEQKRGSGSSSQLSCKYCKKTGHAIEKCYKLHRFPPDFKFTKGKRSAACVQSEGHFHHHNHINEQPSETTGHGFSKEQYDHLMTPFQQLNHPPIIHPETLGSENIGFAHFAGVLNHPEVHSAAFHACVVSNLGSNPWILDSGATNHMTPYKHLLINLTPLTTPFLIILPNGYKVKVISTGSIQLRPDMILHNVLLVPSFYFNLIFIHKLLVHFRCIATLIISAYILQGPSPRRPLKIGKAANGLYFLHPAMTSSTMPVVSLPITVSNPVQCNNSSASYNVQSTPGNVSFTHCTSTYSDINKNDVIWHQRLGHVPFNRMKSIYFLSGKILSKQTFFCDVCPMARQQRLSFSDSSIHSSTPFQLVHIDIWGPYNTQTYNGFRYFLTLVDDFSRVTWTHLLSCKSNALSVLKAFHAMVKVYFHSTVQSFRSDNAYELGSRSEAQQFFSANGILHQTSIPHTPQQNGVVERKHKHLLEVSRALLYQSKLPLKYWGDCVLTATYFINRLPFTVLHNIFPFQKLHGYPHSFDHLTSFGDVFFHEHIFPHHLPPSSSFPSPPTDFVDSDVPPIASPYPAPCTSSPLIPPTNTSAATSPSSPHSSSGSPPPSISGPPPAELLTHQPTYQILFAPLFFHHLPHLSP
ncbi:uncharacterized protein LOC142169605 [Nicotiana tabacum]|uniref:Uncharacterized protein LOC142169605 n=1 Tax=Nicotiana tabacum TaxID=4097 RepID=A0AC58SRI9_TOBAC